MRVLTSIIFKNERRREHWNNEGIREKVFSVLSFLIVFSTFSGFTIWGSIYITEKLNEINQSYAFINIMLAGNLTILFVESIFQILNVLYFSKDLKIFLRMPIKSRDLVHSKLLKLITSEYQMELIMLAIPMIVYGIINSVGLQFYLYIPIILIILPVIPICIISVLISIIMRFTNNIKNKSKAMYITIIIAIVILNIGVVIFGGSGTEIDLFNKEVLSQENILATNIAEHFKIIIPIMNALLNYDSLDGVINICIYIGVSILIYIVSLGVISSVFLKGVVGTVSSGNKGKEKQNKELGIDDFKQNSFKKSYILKEYRAIKRTPIFFIQCIIMPLVLTIILIGVVLILISITNNLGLDIINQMSKNAWFTGAFLAISQILYMMNFSSLIAVSKERGWAVLSKYIPIKLSRQFNMKLYIGKVMNFVSNIGILVFYYICVKSIIYTILLALVTYGLNVFGEKVKIFIDLKNPKTDWDNEYTMMKQNTNVMFELFYTIVITLIIIIQSLIFVNLNIYYIILLISIFFANVSINKYIYNNDNKIFKNLV